jgi:hypothetical protein
MARKDLVAVLSEEKILAARDLERLQRGAGGRPLWLVLLEAELITEEELFFLLAQRWPAATEAVLEKVEVPEAALRVWSRDEASQRGLLPVEIEGACLTAVMVDPSDEGPLRELLQRLSLSEARKLVGRRSLIERAAARALAAPDSQAAEETAKVKVPVAVKTGRPTPRLQPLPRTRSKTEPKVQPSVEIDPQLAEEMRRLPARALQADALTPMPRARRRRSSEGGEGEAEKPFTLEDALHAEEQLSRTLLQAVEVLARELETRISGDGQLLAGEMARLSRRVARKLGLDRRSADEVSTAAYLFAVDRKLRLTETRAADWFGELGWPAANEEGLLPVLRALTATAAGFSRTTAAAPLGARIITVVDDYLQLGAASGEIGEPSLGQTPGGRGSSGEAVPSRMPVEIDLGTVSQLLRTSPAGAPVVDALLRVLESEKVTDPTPATTVTAQSVLHAAEPAAPLSEDKTQRKPAPVAPSPATLGMRARREKE